MKTKNDKEFLETMKRETSSWKGPFYFNRKDPRIIVPKYNPAMGWTLNFASPYAWTGLAAIFIIMTVYSIFFN